jgi:hypothetical protein
MGKCLSIGPDRGRCPLGANLGLVVSRIVPG